MSNSKLKQRQSEVKVGSKIAYSDQCNFMEYEVTELFEGGFTAKALTDDCGIPKGETDSYDFDSLQHGWNLILN